MTALTDSVVTDTLSAVKIVYLDRATSKWYNMRRRPHDTACFCGWFWVKGNDEAGPFKTRSSAIRDAYYRFVIRQDVPDIGHLALPEYRRPNLTITHPTKEKPTPPAPKPARRVVRAQQQGRAA